MSGKSSISKAQSYTDIGEFWDTRDLADYWDQTEPAEFEVGVLSEMTYYALDRDCQKKFDPLHGRGVCRQIRC